MNNITKFSIFFFFFSIITAQTTPVILTPLNATFSGILSSRLTMSNEVYLMNITEFINYQVFSNGELAYYSTQEVYPVETPLQTSYLLLRNDLGKFKYVWQWSNENNCVLTKTPVAFTFVELLNQELENSTIISTTSSDQVWEQTLLYVTPSVTAQESINRLTVSSANTSYVTSMESLNGFCDCEQTDCSIACQECQNDPSACYNTIYFQAPMSQFDYSPMDSSVLDVPSFCPQPKDAKIVSWEKYQILSSLELLRERAHFSSAY